MLALLGGRLQFFDGLAVLERRSLDRAPTGEILQRLNPYTKSYSLKPALGRPHVVAPPGQ